MTITLTATETYTKVDIAKVFEYFSAELRLIARTTGCWSDEYAIKVASDATAFAKEQYLSAVHILLSQGTGEIIRVNKYNVSTAASDWTSQRPGGNVWPHIPGASLTIILIYSKQWNSLDENARQRFKKGLQIQWGPSGIDTTYPGLSETEIRRYSSNAYGLNRSSLARS